MLNAEYRNVDTGSKIEEFLSFYPFPFSIKRNAQKNLQNLKYFLQALEEWMTDLHKIEVLHVSR